MVFLFASYLLLDALQVINYAAGYSPGQLLLSGMG